MSLLSKLVTLALIALIAALVLPAQGRAFARARHRIAAAQAWHQARLEIQMLAMDDPEIAKAVEPALTFLNSTNPIP